jgi:hypothetical protein
MHYWPNRHPVNDNTSIELDGANEIWQYYKL